MNLAIFLVLFARALFHGAQPASSPNLRDELPRIPAKSPEDSRKSIQIADGFEIALVAHEPTVVDPIAAAFDENGALYVVEMRDYPFPQQPPLGRIRLLEDRDDDGFFEHSSIFADHLAWPTGIAVHDGGVFVAAAPDIWWLKDTNGDQQADVREKLLTGFGTGNVQGLLNGLVWGLDHRIYGASASNGGQVRLTSAPKSPNGLTSAPGSPGRSVHGSDFRFDPTAALDRRPEAFETIEGSAQYGNSFDDVGHRFLCSNSNHAQLATLPRHYLERNPHLVAPSAVTSIAFEGPAAPVFRLSQPEPWRVVRTRRRAASGTAYPPTELVVTGFFTSASGITVYRGEAFPPSFRGNLFIGDVGGNLVHRKLVRPKGSILEAVRADVGREFIASTDNWFRPVTFVNAPDGTLYLLDMYRETIEHPASIPDDIKAHLDLTSGRDRGRIYRIAPKGFKRPKTPRLGATSTADLVATLEHPNAWHRETAHRLLHARQDPSAIPLLRATLQRRRAPLGRLHALWSLEGQRELSQDDLVVALRDSWPPVREHALRLSEKRPWSKSMRDLLLSLVDDENAEVRRQLAFSLGEQPGERGVSAALATLIRRDGSDEWARIAALSSSWTLAKELLLELDRDAGFRGGDVARSVARPLALMATARNQQAGQELIERLSATPRDPPHGVDDWTIAVLLGMADGYGKKGIKLNEQLKSERRGWWEEQLTRCAALAVDGHQALSARTQAIALLGLADWKNARTVLPGLLKATEPDSVQRAALAALVSFSREDVPNVLTMGWSDYGPTIRAEVIEALLSRPRWAAALLDAIERGTVSKSLIPPTRIALLRKNAELRPRVEKIFSQATSASRASVIERYRPALSTPGDAQKGKVVYQRECRGCHRLAGDGFDVGPHLATVANREPDALMLAVLDPHREVAPNYLEYVAVLRDGRVITGMVASESAAGLSFRRAQGAEEVVARADIESLSTTNKSLMPEGLEEKISPQELMDLFAFIKKAAADR